jgi:hypothetical protein
MAAARNDNTNHVRSQNKDIVLINGLTPDITQNTTTNLLFSTPKRIFVIFYSDGMVFERTTGATVGIAEAGFEV